MSEYKAPCPNPDCRKHDRSATWYKHNEYDLLKCGDCGKLVNSWEIAAYELGGSIARTSPITGTAQTAR